nr:MAG TPA: hypothetical protein [Caudoviricetes sp.]
MDINEIIPYARNARHNKKAIPAVADSIRQVIAGGSSVNNKLLDEYLS